MTWPAFKACEGHVVLIALTALAALALVEPTAWLASWRWAVRGMAVLAPTLAIARIAKGVAGGPSRGSSPAGSGKPDRNRRH